MQRGIIVNREVVIRRKQGNGKPGEQTDIYIDAIAVADGSKYDIITVIIETKGCWHPDLDTAMEGQLVQRYMLDSRCNHGLYLVGWFQCQQWDKLDRRYKASPQIALPSARAKFEAQAVSLSQAGKVVRSFVLDAALR